MGQGPALRAECSVGGTSQLEVLRGSCLDSPMLIPPSLLIIDNQVAGNGNNAIIRLLPVALGCQRPLGKPDLHH